VRKPNKVVGCAWGIGERKWGGDFRKRMIGGRDLGMEGTRGGGENVRKIFEMGARSGQRNARLRSEGRVQEEQPESEREEETGKV
jgi:hypothetical protein